jgi:hypothetical protein
MPEEPSKFRPDNPPPADRTSPSSPARAYGPQPADRAFIAMTLWKLGREDEARTALKAFRELAAQERWKADEETQTWLKEAEALITPKP